MPMSKWDGHIRPAMEKNMEISPSQAALAYAVYAPILQAIGVSSGDGGTPSPFETRDRVSISPEGAALAQSMARTGGMQESARAEEIREASLGEEAGEAPHSQGPGETEGGETSGDAELSEGEKEQVQDLKKRDQEVRAHEAAHMAAGAGVVRSGASFSYQQGPDGKRYAVGGEVQVDTSRESEPEATLQKMQQVKRAALAPASPSGQDRSVAARATSIMADARAEMAEEARAATEADGSTETDESVESAGAGPVESDSEAYETAGTEGEDREYRPVQAEPPYMQENGVSFQSEFGPASKPE